MDVAEVHVRSWQVAYRGLLPDGYLNEMDPTDRASRYTFSAREPDAPCSTVAVDDTGRLIGFATTGPSRDEDLRSAGELYAIYVHPECWGGGAGRALVADARDRLQKAFGRTAFLWVLIGNERTERFYIADGWAHDGSRRTEDVHGVVADVKRYVRALP